MIGKDLFEIYEGEVHSAYLQSGAANGILYRDSVPYFFTIDMNEGPLELETLSEDNSTGITSHIGVAIFGQFTRDHSFYFDPILKAFMGIDVEGSIVDFFTSNDKALLQTQDGNENSFFVFDGEEVIEVNQTFGDDVTVASRSDGAFIIIESQENGNTLYYIDGNGNISDSINTDGNRLMLDDQYLLDGPFSVLFFHENDILTTVMSLYGKFQISEAEYSSIGSNPLLVRYSKGQEGILHQQRSEGQINYTRWNSEIIQLEVPTRESLVIANFDEENIRLVSSYFSESSYNVLDKVSGALLKRDELDNIHDASINYSQNQKFRLNESGQYLLSSDINAYGPHPPSLVADFSDLESMSITSLQDFEDGPGLYRASDYIYTDNFIYAKALFDNVRSEYQLYRIPTSDNVTSTYNFESITDSKLNIFPNISNDYIMIDIDLFNLRILNQNGKVVYSESELRSYERLSTELLVRGVYYLQGVGSEGEHILGKFIKS